MEYDKVCGNSVYTMLFYRTLIKGSIKLNKWTIMELWIARNQDNSLWLHEEKPSLVYDEDIRKWFYEGGSFMDIYDESLFPEVTFENSPKRIELKLVEEYGIK